MQIKIKLLSDKSHMPQKAHNSDTGYDLYASEAIIVPPGKTILVPLGFIMEIPDGHGIDVQIRSRSGLALKSNIMILNSPGTIDSNYRAEVKAIVHNFSDKEFEVLPGMRIAQMVIGKVFGNYEAQLIEVDKVSDTDRGTGGFGSTGV